MASMDPSLTVIINRNDMNYWCFQKPFYNSLRDRAGEFCQKTRFGTPGFSIRFDLQKSAQECFCKTSSEASNVAETVTEISIFKKNKATGARFALAEAHVQTDIVEAPL